MKIGILGYPRKPATRPNSHNAGHTLVSKSIIEMQFNAEAEFIHSDNINEYDKVVILTDVNYSGDGINYFGGVKEDTKDTIKAIHVYKGELFSINYDLDLNVLFNSRKELRALNLINFPDIITVYSDYNDKIIIGDSHSLSIYKPGYGINRNDGKSLYGFLKEPESYINYEVHKEIVLYFGNIDIRFHLHRQECPYTALNDLIKNYSEAASSLINVGIKVKIQGLLPIEDESRKLPGTGLYKGQPFYGTQKERQAYVDYFNEQMTHNSEYYGFTFEQPWLDAPLCFTKMEARQSVHVAPKYYKYANEIQILLPSSETQTILFS